MSCIVPARKHVVSCVTVKVVTSCHILHCYSKICYKLCSRFKVCFNTFPCGWQYSLRTLTGYWMLADLAIWSLYSMFRTVHSVESLWTSHIITSSVPAVVVSPQQRSFRSRDGTVPVNLSLSHKQSVLEIQLAPDSLQDRMYNCPICLTNIFHNMLPTKCHQASRPCFHHGSLNVCGVF